MVTLSVTYIVTCVLCDFKHEIDELEDVFEFRDTHQANYGDRHIIEFGLIEESDKADD